MTQVRWQLWGTLALGLLVAWPAGAQSANGPLGSSSKALLPRTITNAGGEFQVDEIATMLDVYPAAERFEANSTIRCTGTRGNVRLAAFVLNGGRRATSVREQGRELPFTHSGDFLTVRLANPIAAGQRRTFELRYTGKAHSVSSHWIKDYRIDWYGMSLRVLPQTGNLTAVAKLKLIGEGSKQTPPRPQPTRWPGVPQIKKRWIPPMLNERDEPKLGLVLNNNYAIDRVTVAEQDSPYTHANGIVAIKIGQALQPGEIVPVTVFYTGKIRNSDRNRIWDNFDNEPRPSNPVGAE